MSGPIKIKVLETKDLPKADACPWDMVISDRENITAYMARGTMLLFNYRGDIYHAHNITERDFLELCPHLKTK